MSVFIGRRFFHLFVVEYAVVNGIVLEFVEIEQV